MILQVDGNDSISSVSSSSSHQPIPVYISCRTPVTSANIKYGPQNNHTIKRSNKTSVSLCLPNICNINPQSVYNKQEEFITFVEEMVSDVIFMSESWERENLTLDNIMKPLENHTVVSNVHQRGGRGGRPALIINCRKYHVQNITQSLISIPWGVEAVWAIITPKDVQSNSIIQKIVLGSIYLRPAAQSHGPLLDHITDVFNILSTKYPKGLHWIIAGDTNQMKLDSILFLDPRLKQIVQTPTRLNPDAILDPIMTTLSTYYQVPVCLPPLGADDGVTESDHLTVVAEPVSAINNRPARVIKKVRVRRLPQSGKDLMRSWISQQNWDEVTAAESAHEKALVLQSMLMEKVDQFLPESTVSFSSDDQPWFTPELKQLDKTRKTEYRRHRRSFRWKKLNKRFKEKVAKTKATYYEKKVKDIKEGKPGQWYSLLKRMCTHDQLMKEKLVCEEIQDQTDQQQAELIADKFSSVSNEYSPIDASKIHTLPVEEGTVPIFTPLQVLNQLLKLKNKKSTAPNDIPSVLLKEYAEYICVPLCHIINSCISRGEYPRIWKVESQIPIPKEYPVLSMDMLRNISILKNFDKIAESLLADIMVSDMKESMDKAQYGNCKGVSVQHYLMKMIHTILQKLDNNGRGDTFAVVAACIDWKQAFPRQCPTLGVQSWIQNGVRPALIPLLTDFFRDRVMSVRWHGVTSSERTLSGSGPQGSTLGLLEYLSQSNNNTENIPPDMKYKWLDDLTVLEVINLLTIGISSYNIKAHVASDIPVHNGFVAGENLKIQENIHQIQNWTMEKLMKLNQKKSCGMIFNFTQNYQFTSRLSIDSQPLQMVDKTKLLGLVLTSDLKWTENTKSLIKRANARMEILRKMSSFSAPVPDMLTAYKTYIRSILEQSCVIWHSSITEEDREGLERVQKNACRNILKEKYLNYELSLLSLKLDTLFTRREKLLYSFGKKCLTLEQSKELFPKNNKSHNMNTRIPEEYQVIKTNTERFKNSTVPYIQRMLNKKSPFLV